MTPDEFLRKYGMDDQSLKEREHSLQENSRERASRPHQPNAGSPHDWELWQKLHDEVDVSDDPDPFRPTRNLPPDTENAVEQSGFWQQLKRFFTRHH